MASLPPAPDSLRALELSWEGAGSYKGARVFKAGGEVRLEHPMEPWREQLPHKARLQVNGLVFLTFARIPLWLKELSVGPQTP